MVDSLKAIDLEYMLLKMLNVMNGKFSIILRNTPLARKYKIETFQDKNKTKKLNQWIFNYLTILLLISINQGRLFCK